MKEETAQLHQLGLTLNGKPLSRIRQIRSQWKLLQKLISEEVQNRMNSTLMEQLIKKNLNQAVSTPNFQSLTSDTPEDNAEWHEEQIAYDQNNGGKGNTNSDIQWHIQQIIHDMTEETQ